MDPSGILKKAYLLDTVDRSRVMFDYMPQEISDEKAASYESTNIIGRSEPIIGYSNSESRNIPLELQFIASKYQGDDGTYEKLMEKTRWLRSLAYPDYSSRSFVKPPHVCFLKIGKLLSQRVVVVSANCNYKGPWNKDLLPFIVTVSLSLQEVNEKPFDVYNVRKGKDIFAYSKAYKYDVGV